MASFSCPRRAKPGRAGRPPRTPRLFVRPGTDDFSAERVGGSMTPKRRRSGENRQSPHARNRINLASSRWSKPAISRHAMISTPNPVPINQVDPRWRRYSIHRAKRRAAGPFRRGAHRRELQLRHRLSRFGKRCLTFPWLVQSNHRDS